MKILNPYLFRIRSFFSLMVLGLFLYGCSTTSTVITGSWTNDKAERPSKYNHIVVTPLIADASINTDMETELAKSLAARDVQVEMGRLFLPKEYTNTPTENDKAKILESVKTSGADAILTVSIIDKESETRYVPGSYAYAPYPTHSYYGNFWGYYNYWTPRVYDPGYYVTEKFYYVETNLFDAQSEELIWSAQTETYDTPTIESFTDDFSRKIANELKDAGLI